MAPPIDEGGGVLSGGTAGLLNCPEDCLVKEGCWCAGGGCSEPAEAAADERRDDEDDDEVLVTTPVDAAAILAISVSQSLGATKIKLLLIHLKNFSFAGIG